MEFTNDAKNEIVATLYTVIQWLFFHRTMWNPGNGNSQTGQVAARMETTPSLGSASISVSQQQTPKKFAPVVAPKPKFNPYKQMGDPAHSDPAGKETCEPRRTGNVVTWLLNL